MESVREIVKEKYGEAARRVASGAGNGCCCERPLVATQMWIRLLPGSTMRRRRAGCPKKRCSPHWGVWKPDGARNIECGRDRARPGERRRHRRAAVRPASGADGQGYGLDMTDDMLALARANQKKAGVANVEFLKGEIENIPLPDNSVDVIISN